MFQFVDMQIVISRKKIRNMSKKSYKKSQRSMKFLIKNFQTNDIWTKKFCSQNARFRRRRKRLNKTWFLNFEKFITYNERLYILDDEIVRKKFLNKNHDDFLVEHFEIEIFLKLIQRKYFWFECNKQTKKYVKICDVCQRIKMFKYKSYDELQSLSIFKKSWKKIIMNFVIDLFSSKRKEIVYNSIFVMIDRYIKMIKYIFVIVKIDVAKLTKMFFKKIVLRFDMSRDIINDKDFVFINVFWIALCYHARIKRRLNIAFHFQINELIERQNQVFEHYLRTFVDTKQTK